MKAGKCAAIGFLLILGVLFSCGVAGSKKAAAETAMIFSSSPDAFESVLEAFQTARIVFIGGASHRLINEKLFLNESLQRLYDAGVRYILAEGGKDDSPVYSDEDLTKEYFLLFYPWEYVGVRYGVTDIGINISMLNMGKEEADTIKLVGLESGRINFVPGQGDPAEQLNYRDEYMADTAFEFIDNAAPQEKFLVIAGGAHGNTSSYEYTYNSPSPWKPLGAYLKEKYQNDFLSFYYITLDEILTQEDEYQKLLQSKEWQSIPDSPRFLTKPKIDRVNELLPLLYQPYFDGFIVDKTGILGIMYSYALFDPAVLKQVIEQTRQYDIEIAAMNRKNRLDYRNPQTYVTIRNYITNVYYLKLFFGDNFPYEFWKPGMPLQNALDLLESAVLIDDINPAEKMAFALPSIDTIRQYHGCIESFYYSLKDTTLQANPKKIFKIHEPYMKRAQELFPYELWTKYWYVKMYIELKDYKQAYTYAQEILNDELVYSMQIYPETLELAAQCAEQLGENENAGEYRSQKALLKNEHHIDAGIFGVFLD